MRRRARRAVDALAWLGRHELGVLLSLVAFAGGVWAFVEIADEVLEGAARSFDESILLAMRTPGALDDPLGPGWVEEMGRDLTALGGVAVLLLLTVAVLGFLLLAGKYRAALFAAVAVMGGWVASSLLKLGFERPRPDLVPHESMVYTASFPSGHSMMSAVTYLTLAALLARVQSRLRLKAYLLSVAMIMTLMVGVSRVYLGVHWPTDVLAGWTAGAAWAAFCWLVARGLQRRGRLEADGERYDPPASG